MTRERLILWPLLAVTFAIRAIHPGQPIVENYVGRQIPTAMVARNLDRGSGFLRPQLDTGPFPNLFLVEPPIYAQVVVWLRRMIGFDLEPTGRLVSALATTLAAWGLFGLTRRREGPLVAFLALGSFCCFPVMIRYGRAFQPDALMLGCILAGLRGWDEYEDQGNWRWAAFGGFVLSIGLALKITVAWALIPFVLIVRRWPIGWRLVASVTMLLPAFSWYLYVWQDVVQPGAGSLASFDNASYWLSSLSPGNWVRFSTYANLGQSLFLLAFTPIGFVLGFWGWLPRRAGLALPRTGMRQGKPCPTESCKVDWMWLGWGIGCALSILSLASKWHHAYYWMVVAPLASIGVARTLVNLSRLGKFGRPMAALLGSFFLSLCLAQSASTWRTPADWKGLVEASETIRSLTSEDERVIAPEAVLYFADRPGYRLEFDPSASMRAMGEWGLMVPKDRSPLDLTEAFLGIHFSQTPEITNSLNSVHHTHTSRMSLLVADVGSEQSDKRRHAWRVALRNRPRTKIVIDRPDSMIAQIQ